MIKIRALILEISSGQNFDHIHTYAYTHSDVQLKIVGNDSTTFHFRGDYIPLYDNFLFSLRSEKQQEVGKTAEKYIYSG